MTTIAHREDSRALDIDPATGRRSPRRTLWSIQCLRALAALMVVTGHAQTALDRQLVAFGRGFERLSLPWGAGVDLFFVISGFVMVYASQSLFGARHGATTFLARRFARIVPLYWLATGLFLLLLAAASLKGGDRFPSIEAILTSLLFLPFDTWGRGAAFPVLDLGWTLNYELFFYLLFAPFVLLVRRRALTGVLLVLVVLVLAGTRPDASLAITFWTRPIILDFALGVAVGWLATREVRLRGSVRLALALAGACLFMLDPWHSFVVAPGGTVTNGLPRVLSAALPAAAFLAAATLGDEPSLSRAIAPLTAIGDASYSLYLLHPFALILVAKLVQKFEVVRAAPPALLIGAILALALALALASFRWFERPVTRLLTRAYPRTPLSPPAWRPSMPGRRS